MTYLKRKGISLSPKVYFIDALSYMALGLFATLVVGLILKTAGGLLSLPLIIKMGTLAMGLMGPAIGVAVAYRLQASPLIIFASVVSGAAGAELGGPAGSFVAALIGVELGKLVSGETKIDIILTPLVTIITGFATAALIGPGIEAMMTGLGRLIMWGTDQSPLIMGMLVATIVGLALSSPISSAALALMLDLSGTAAGAATIGCCAQMVSLPLQALEKSFWRTCRCRYWHVKIAAAEHCEKSPYPYSADDSGPHSRANWYYWLWDGQ